LEPKSFVLQPKTAVLESRGIVLELGAVVLEPKNSFCNRKPLFWKPKASFFSGKPTRNSRVTGSSRAESKKDVFLENQPVTLELRVLKERSGILVFLKAPVTLKLREDNSEITGFPVYETNICIDECLFDRKIIPDFWNLPFFMLSLKMARQTPTKYNPFFPRLPNKKVEMAST